MVDESHARFLAHAVRLAAEGVRTGAGGPFGAVVVRDGTVLAEGCNQVPATLDPTAHSEVVAIRAACAAIGSFQLTGAVIYSSCEPCPMCLGAIYWARPDAVYFASTRADAAAAGFDDSFIYDQVQLPPAERAIRFAHLPVPDAVQVFGAWTAKADRVEY